MMFKEFMDWKRFEFTEKMWIDGSMHEIMKHDCLIDPKLEGCHIIAIEIRDRTALILSTHHGYENKEWVNFNLLDWEPGKIDLWVMKAFLVPPTSRPNRHCVQIDEPRRLRYCPRFRGGPEVGDFDPIYIPKELLFKYSQ